jgi:hypothetical protein
LKGTAADRGVTALRKYASFPLHSATGTVAKALLKDIADYVGTAPSQSRLPKNWHPND